MTDIEMVMAELRNLSAKVDGVQRESAAARIEVAAFGKILTDHMKEEEESDKEIALKLTQLTELMHSMPHDENGRPDLFGHRVDHDDLRRGAKEKFVISTDLKKEAIKLVLIGVIVLLASGHYAELIKAIL